MEKYYKGRSIIELGVIWQVGDEKSLDFLFVWWTTSKLLGLYRNIIILEDLNNAKVSDFILSNKSWDVNKLQTILPCDITSQNHIT